MNRILSIYERLCEGHGLTKKVESDSFHVTEKTIQRDLDGIRDYLGTMKTNEFIEYNRKEKVYKLEGGNNPHLQNEEILAIVKILIESRAFPKFDMDLFSTCPFIERRIVYLEKEFGGGNLIS